MEESNQVAMLRCCQKRSCVPLMGSFFPDNQTRRDGPPDPETEYSTGMVPRVKSRVCRKREKAKTEEKICQKSKAELLEWLLIGRTG